MILSVKSREKWLSEEGQAKFDAITLQQAVTFAASLNTKIEDIAASSSD